MDAPPALLEHGAALPGDLVERIGDRGDSYRDDFTRTCLYLATAPMGADGLQLGSADGALGTVIVGTRYGNAQAMAALLQRGAELGRRLSAQYFTNALTSSAGAFVNMAVGATGRNMTVSSGELTPVIAFWHALLALRTTDISRSSLLLGDVYSDEARADVERLSEGASCRSGVVRAQLTAGSDYRAEFDFSASPGDGAPRGPGARVTVGEPGDAREVYAGEDFNTAFAAAEFFDRVLHLDPSQEVTMTCTTLSGRSAHVAVARTHDMQEQS